MGMNLEMGVPAGMLSGTYDPSKGVIGGLNFCLSKCNCKRKNICWKSILVKI